MTRAAPTGPAIAVAALFGLILAGAASPGSSPLERRASTDVTIPAPENASLAIDPSSWTMPAGSVASFHAFWVSSSPECAIVPDWFDWSEPDVPGGGTLAPQNGPTVNFTAASAGSERTTLATRGAAEVSCSGAVYTIFASTDANVSVIAPLGIENLSVAPTAIEPGGTAFLRANLTGGTPPYTVDVEWGDGTSSTFNVPAAGTFGAQHPYPTGSYSPSVTANDSTGDDVSMAAAETVVATNAMVAGISPGNSVADVGVPLPWNVSVLNAPSSYRTAWSCGSPPLPGDINDGVPTNLSCTFSSPGPGPIYFAVRVPPPGPSYTALVTESVLPDPTLSAAEANATIDEGSASELLYNASFGVPPFAVEWTLLGAGLAGSLEVPADGSFLLPLDPFEPGSFSLEVRLADADGATTAAAPVAVRVSPALTVIESTARTLNTSGARVAVTGAIGGGTPPFLWAIVADAPATNATAPGGTVGAADAFVWAGAFALEGTVNLTAIVIDGTGAMTSDSEEIVAVPPFHGTLGATAASPASSGAIVVSATFRGGLPPFSVVVTANDGENWTRSAPNDGQYAWNLPVSSRGFVTIDARTVDALGANLSWTGTLNVSVPSIAPPATGGTGPSPDPVVAGVVGLLTLAVAIALLVRRRRRPTFGTEIPDPVAVLERIIAPADGADRATVELLAEEEGVPLETVRQSLDRLVREGRIRSETDPDGTEALSWVRGRRP